MSSFADLDAELTADLEWNRKYATTPDETRRCDYLAAVITYIRAVAIARPANADELIMGCLSEAHAADLAKLSPGDFLRAKLLKLYAKPIVSIAYTPSFVGRPEVVVACAPLVVQVTVKPKAVPVVVPEPAPTAERAAGYLEHERREWANYIDKLVEPSSLPVTHLTESRVWKRRASWLDLVETGELRAPPSLREVPLVPDPVRACVYSGLVWNVRYGGIGDLSPEAHRRNLCSTLYKACPSVIPSSQKLRDGEILEDTVFVNAWETNFRIAERMDYRSVGRANAWLGALAAVLPDVRVDLGDCGWEGVVNDNRGFNTDALLACGLVAGDADPQLNPNADLHSFSEGADNSGFVLFKVARHYTALQRLKLRMIYWQMNPPATVTYGLGTARVHRGKERLFLLPTALNDPVALAIRAASTVRHAKHRFPPLALSRTDSWAVNDRWGFSMVCPATTPEWYYAHDVLAARLVCHYDLGLDRLLFGVANGVRSADRYIKYCVKEGFRTLLDTGTGYVRAIHRDPLGHTVMGRGPSETGSIKVRGVLPTPRDTQALWCDEFREQAYRMALIERGVVVSQVTNGFSRGLSEVQAYLKDVKEYLKLLGITDVRVEPGPVKFFGRRKGPLEYDLPDDADSDDDRERYAYDASYHGPLDVLLQKGNAARFCAQDLENDVFGWWPNRPPSTVTEIVNHVPGKTGRWWV